MNKKVSILIISSMFLFTGCSTMGSSVKKTPVHSTEQKKTEKNLKKANGNKLTLSSKYFNKIRVIDGKNVIQNPDNILELVNKTYNLSSDYIPKDLVRPNVAFSFDDLSLEKSLMRKEAADALEKMFSNAKDSGIELYVVSGYRSYNYQNSLFNAEVRDVGVAKAAEAVAVPGTSEHQSGLAVDIGCKSTNFYLTTGFAQSKEGIWLSENAYRFGYILRYPKNKEGITHYEYEPWHYRYVGVKAATIIYQHHWTLEEYFKKVKTYK